MKLSNNFIIILKIKFLRCGECALRGRTDLFNATSLIANTFDCRVSLFNGTMVL